MAKSQYSIAVFSWNTESINLCETLSQETADYNRGKNSYGFLGYKATTWQYSCKIPDFFDKYAEIIVASSPDVVVIGFQEDRKPGSYFHSHLLVEEMPKLGYSLIKRTRLMGVGVTSVKNAMKGDLHTRGIRLSVYVKQELIDVITEAEGQSEYLCSSNLTRGKGAAASYISIQGVGKLAFICAHLPFNSSSLIDAKVQKNPMIRQNELNYSNTCYNNIIEALVLQQGEMPDYVFYFGDLNYRVNAPDGAQALAQIMHDNYNNPQVLNNIYLEYDELKEQMRRKNIYEFSEGVNNSGPNFAPTCKMKKNRITNTCYDKDEVFSAEKPTSCWKLGNLDQRIPSWCDRILFKKFGNSPQDIVCTYYDRFDTGETMALSDHAGVVALFNTL